MPIDPLERAELLAEVRRRTARRRHRRHRLVAGGAGLVIAGGLAVVFVAGPPTGKADSVRVVGRPPPSLAHRPRRSVTSTTTRRPPATTTTRVPPGTTTTTLAPTTTTTRISPTTSTTATTTLVPSTTTTTRVPPPTSTTTTLAPSTTTTTGPPPTTTTVAVPGVVAACTSPSPSGLRVRPGSITLACADNGMGVEAVAWTAWTASEATGQGKLWENNCTPNCAQGKTETYPVRVTLSVVKTSSQGPWFSRLNVAWQGAQPSNATPDTFTLPPPGN